MCLKISNMPTDLTENSSVIAKCWHLCFVPFQVDETQKKKRAFRKFTYRGVDLDQLLDMPKWVFNDLGEIWLEILTQHGTVYSEQLVELMHSRARRRFSRGLKRKPMALIKKLRKAKKEAPPNEKPAIVKTHLRNMIVVPEMVGSIIGIYNGKTFNQVRTLVSCTQRTSFTNIVLYFIVLRLKSNPKWLVTTWVNSRWHTNPSSTAGPVLVPPTVQDLFHSSKI